MLKVNSSPFLFLKRTVYHAIKSINESPTLYAMPSIKISEARMQAWILYYYGSSQQFTLSDSVPSPILTSPKDVLIKVTASSVNPIDFRRRGKTINKRNIVFFFTSLHLIFIKQKAMVVS